MGKNNNQEKNHTYTNTNYTHTEIQENKENIRWVKQNINAMNRDDINNDINIDFDNGVFPPPPYRGVLQVNVDHWEKGTVVVG